jgi:hypothetical protein
MIDLITPDDFASDPYTGGLNQMGHAVLGGALALFMGYWAGVLIIGWEAWQLKRKGALRADYWADLSFWAIGVFMFQWEYFLPFIAGLGFTWMIYIDRR